MERKLKPHEKVLLKKVNLVEWRKENNVREVQVLRRYRVENREDYLKYALHDTEDGSCDLLSLLI